MRPGNLAYKLFSLLLFVLSILIISCGGDTSAPPSTTLTRDNIQKLQAAADNIMMNYQTPGMVAYIATEGEGELYITRGVGNIITSDPISKDNFFRIASITKTFTTEAVLILADKGLIDLDKPISFYLPELNVPSGDKMTVRMLGNMTSGLFNYSDDNDLMRPWYASLGEKIYTPEELAAAVFKHPPNFTPGSKYEYSNTNTILLGLLIKKVTGRAVGDVLSELIFQPLGMANTFWPNTRFLPYPYTHGYSNLTGMLLDVTNWNPSWGDAAGILISNIADLKIWVKEINERNLLSSKSKNERTLWVDRNPANPGIALYGFGIMKLADWVGHPGIIEGYNSQVYYNPLKKTTIIVTTNSANGTPAEAAFLEFAKILDAKLASLL